MSTTDLVVKRYAKALFGSALKSNNLDVVSKSFEEFSQLFQEMPKDVYGVFLDPTFPKNKFQDCIKVLLVKHPNIVQNFCTILIQEGRLKFIGAINKYFQMLSRNLNGETVADVWVAYSMPKSFYTEIEKILSLTFNSNVLLNVCEDVSLLGGIIIEIKGVRLDASVSGTLKQLSYHMKGVV